LKKIPFFFLFVILLLQKANGQIMPDSSLGNFALSASYHYGFIIAHRESIVPFQQDHTKSFELDIKKHTYGRKEWQQIYYYPDIGIKYLFIDLGNPGQLGNAHALIPYLDLILNKNQNAQLSFNFGWGIGYIEKIFDTEYNYKNIAIGSHWNAALAFSTDFKLKLFKQTFLHSGISLTHFSNGSTVVPNLGLNVASVKIGITHNFGEKNLLIKDSLPPFERCYRNTFYVAGGIKEIYPVYGPDYYVVAFSATRLRQLTRKKAVGLGVDIHYDESLVYKLEGDSVNGDSDSNNSFSSNLRAGINGTYEFIFSDFSILVQMGGYVYNKVKSDGSIYNRIGLRYQFSKNYFACYNLKSHWAKADFFEFGIGMKL
jgi:hypothetical protein